MPDQQASGLRCLGWEGYTHGVLPSAFHTATGCSLSGTDHLSDDAACRQILAERTQWDLININTPFVRDVLHPAGAIVALPARYGVSIDAISGPFARFRNAVMGPSGELLGVPQRFGPFNLVINSNRISPNTARREGFRLALDRCFEGKFGILSYEDFNVMHLAIMADLNPFVAMDEQQIESFRDAAQRAFSAARIVTDDHNVMNRALIRGDIDFYISGGVYTASPARLEGHLEALSITPETGPINGKGAVAFVEVNAQIDGGAAMQRDREAFFDFILSEEGTRLAALAAGACNPVVQMYDDTVRGLFSSRELEAMQADRLEEDLAHCADYDIVPDYQRLVEIVRQSGATKRRATIFDRM